MADPYWRYAAPAERGPRATFPGYLPPHSSALASYPLWGTGDPRGASSNYMQTDVLPLRSGAYGLDDIAAMGSHVTPGLGGLTAGASMRPFVPLEDPSVIKRDAPLRKSEGLAADESNILFVDGLPSDCTRREVGHLFRPFIGFKEIRVVHKEPRKSGDKARVLCFVEFNDAKCAMTALEALQGYKFDDKPEAPILRIQFAKFPFHPPVQDDQRLGVR